MNTHNHQPTYTEQVVSATVQGLRLLEDIFPYEFGETIDTIQRLHELQSNASNPWDKPLTKEQLRNTTICPRHNVFLVPERYGDVDADMVCPKCERELEEQAFIDKYEGKRETAKRQVTELYSVLEGK